MLTNSYRERDLTYISLVWLFAIRVESALYSKFYVEKMPGGFDREICTSPQF